MIERHLRRGMSRRVITSIDLDDPELADIAPQTGAEAWLAEVEAMAADVLCDAGLIERTDDGFRELCRLPDDREDLSARGRAVRVLHYANVARRVLQGSNVPSAFEWGAKLMQAAQGLELELRGWPLAAERGAKSKLGEDKATDPELRARAIRWCDEAARGKVGGIGYKTTCGLIGSREGISFNTVVSAVRRERKRRRA